jgi:hypothetical protein
MVSSQVMRNENGGNAGSCAEYRSAGDARQRRSGDAPRKGRQARQNLQPLRLAKMLPLDLLR